MLTASDNEVHKGNRGIDFEEVKRHANGRWSEILPALTPLTAAMFTKGRDDHPCPQCGGDSVLWPASDVQQSGRFACRSCTTDKPTGDGIATVAAWTGTTQIVAARAVAAYLGMDCTSEIPQQTVIEQVCRDKRMPLDAFMKFGPTIEQRGREKTPVARVPVYNESGEPHSHFDFAPGHKGWFARGKGMAGLFFPGQLPVAGETWLLPEGCKDSAALVGMGYLAAGLPTSMMADKYARLFAGVHVILVPDLDSAGQAGAQKSGGRLFGIAASVRVARLPGEIVEKGGDDVRDVLSRDGGESLVRSAVESAEQWTPREGEVTKDGRPEVLVTLAYGWCCDQVTTHLGRLGWESPWIPANKRERLKIYQRGGALVQVVESDEDEQLAGIDLPEGTARIRPLPVGQLPLRIADACQLLQEKEEEGELVQVAVPPQRWLIDGIFTRGDWGRDVRRLEGIISAPTIRPDGTILQSAGWDKKTGLLYTPNDSYAAIPDKPTLADAQRAVGDLLEVVKDFPFIDDSDRSAWLALVLSEIGRAAIRGCVPLFGITATTRGSGKSLLADTASIIAYGRSAPRKTFSPDDNEQRKAITATAIEALPSVLLDNVDCLLGGSSLDAALTATTWTDRILGASKTTGELPLRTIWTATGNNLRFGSDLARRVLPIRLAPQIENPEEREDFEHDNLLEWVRCNRARLAVAALTILRAYVVAGGPVQPGGVWGSFEAWSSLVRGALVWAGQPDPLATRETAKADDQSGAIVRGLIGGLIDVSDDNEGMTAREIASRLNDPDYSDRFAAMREVVAEVATVRGVVDARKLGYALRKYRGRISGNYEISGEAGHGGLVRWHAKPIRGGDGGDGGDSPGYPVWKTGVSHQDTYATHIDTHGERAGTCQPCQPSPPQATLTGVQCSKCDVAMIPAQLQPDGYRNWDCPKCKAARAVREVSQ